MRKSLRSTGVAVSVVGLLLGTMPGVTAIPGPELEYEWETGTAGTVYDGDTLDVKIATSNSGYTGTQRVRTIGVQAPEVAHDSQAAQCGSAQAKAALKGLAPLGTPIQLRALKGTSYDDYSGGRIVRTAYAQDEEGNWYDTARQLVENGTLLWFPLSDASDKKPEWAHNLEYRVLAEDAAASALTPQPRGLWTPNYCGPSTAANLRMSVSWDQDSSVNGYESVFILNDGADVSLAGWTLRDSALNKYTFPGYAAVPGGRSIEVRLTPGADDPAAGIYYTGGGPWFGNLPANNTSFVGDVAYLMDNAGPYETGNLRSWFPYPCNPDNCRDPLVQLAEASKLDVVTPSAGDWNTGQDLPGTPRQLNANAAADGTGDITATWMPPTYTGGDVAVAPLDYRLTITRVGGSSSTTTVTGTSHKFTGLTAGAAYTFNVLARNPQGSSGPTVESTPVTSRKAPGKPTTVAGQPGDSQIVARWVAPANDNGAPVTSYTATATPAAGTSRSCTTAGPEVSCTIMGLTNGTQYRVTVTAANSAGTSAASDPSAWITSGYTAGATPATAPTNVSAAAGNGSAIVTWTPPTQDGGTPITQYTVVATQDTTKVCATNAIPGTPATNPPTSCVVPGLTNGVAYTFTVTATAPPGGPASAASSSITPAADARVHTALGSPGPDTGIWTPRETIQIANKTASPVDLTGYALWDKDPRSSNGGQTQTDTPDYVFPRGTTIPANATLKVRSGPPTSLEPGSATLYYTGKDPKFTSSADLIEFSNLNKALVDCAAWGGTTCRGQQQVTTPTQPVGITARTTPTSVTVQWGVPISRGGTAITGYTATAFDASNGGNVLGQCSTDGSGRSCTIPGAIGVRYFAEVVAQNAVGTSPPSAPRALAAPRTAPSAPGSVAVTGTAGGLAVTWTPAAENGAVISKYTASAYLAGTGGSPVSSCATSNGSMGGCTIPNLKYGTVYYVDVTATNRAGTGAPSSPRATGMPTSAPSAISTYSKGKVTVRWDPPSDGKAVITGYAAKLYTKASGGKLVGSCSAPYGKTSCKTKKMKKRSKYYIALTTNTTVGSFTVTPRIVTGPPKKASAPKITSATPTGNRVTIAWATPTFNGYSYLKGYGARLYSKNKGGSVKATCSAGPSTTACTTKALKKKGTYYSAVRVKNSKGWSKWSKRVKVVVR